MNIFQTITAGDSARWHDDPWTDPVGGTTYASDAWTLSHELRGPAVLTLTSTVDGSGWQTVMNTAQSATLLPGAYSWAAYLSKTGERKTIGRGALTVTPDLATAIAGYDGRSVAVKALADCEAALANFNTTGGKVKKYMIGTRQMEFQTLAELMQLLSYWKIRVANENAAVAIANGLGNPRNLKVRFL